MNDTSEASAGALVERVLAHPANSAETAGLGLPEHQQHVTFGCGEGYAAPDAQLPGARFQDVAWTRAVVPQMIRA